MPSRVACYALLTLCLLLIIWLRSRRVVLTPPRLAHHASSTSADALGPLPFEVEWHVPVGCGFSGFFVEVALGFVPPLAGSGSLRLMGGGDGGGGGGGSGVTGQSAPSPLHRQRRRQNLVV